METIEFKAIEYHADCSFGQASYRYEGAPENGWEITRQGKPYLELPQGYRLLRSSLCGICSTDLARHHLPFPLPQVTGHEVVAQDESGNRVAPEINASHYACGSRDAQTCPLCRNGLSTHCPNRMVLGIDRLPGGFAPWILVPERSIVEIPKALHPDISVLIEPFAAARHAAGRIHLNGTKRVGVLGLGRLGLLVLAALRSAREAMGESFSIEGIHRNPDRGNLARSLGADTVWGDVDSIRTDSGLSAAFDVIIEATGSPLGLETALGLASKEVHVKSTTGQETLGLKHLTELVVDEVSVGRFEPDGFGQPGPAVSEAERTALIFGSGVGQTVGDVLEKWGYSIEVVDRIQDFKDASRERLLEDCQADLCVVDSIDAVDDVIRPWPDREWGFVRPRGDILVADVGQPRQGLLEPLLGRKIRISTSRCGDFRRAIPALEALMNLGIDPGVLVTDRFPLGELPRAFDQARSGKSIKVVITHQI